MFSTKSKIIASISIGVLFIISCGGNDNPSKPEDKSPKIETKKSINKTAKEINSLGARLYILCDACHSLGDGDAHKTGPNLHGLFGRKAGTAEGFSYSDAIINSGIVWDEQHLKNWLSDPDGYIPGTAMAFIGITDSDNQDALISYLKKSTE